MDQAIEGAVVEARVATSYCQKLVIGNLAYWRLPTADEIGKLEQYDRTTRKYRSPQALNLGEGCYFSSKKDNYGIANFYYCFGGGGFRALDSPNSVLCVHSVSH